MTLRQLQILREVLRRRSLTGAADELGLTQPAVSMQMKALAAEIGAPLFRPEGRRLEGTAAAEILGSYAERILRLVDEAALAATLPGPRAAVVRVAASTTPGVNLLPGLIAGFRRKNAATRVQLEVRNSADVERQVSSGEADLGVIGGPRTIPRLRAEPWRDDELVLAVPPEHRLARRRRVRVGELAGDTLLMRERGSATRASVEAAFLRAGVALPPVSVMGDAEAIKRAVENGLGIAIVSRFSIEREARAGTLGMARLADIDLLRPLHLLWDPTREPTSAGAEFLDFVRAARPARRDRAHRVGRPARSR